MAAQNHKEEYKSFTIYHPNNSKKTKILIQRLLLHANTPDIMRTLGDQTLLYCAGAIELSKLLPQYPSLLNIIVCDHSILFDGALSLIIAAMQNCRELQSLDLSGNNIGPNLDMPPSDLMKNAEQLAQTIEPHCNMRLINLSNNNINPYGLQRLSFFILKCPFATVNFYANNVTEKETAPLLLELKNLTPEEAEKGEESLKKN